MDGHGDFLFDQRKGGRRPFESGDRRDMIILQGMRTGGRKCSPRGTLLLGFFNELD